MLRIFDARSLKQFFRGILGIRSVRDTNTSNNTRGYFPYILTRGIRYSYSVGNHTCPSTFKVNKGLTRNHKQHNTSHNLRAFTRVKIKTRY